MGSQKATVSEPLSYWIFLKKKFKSLTPQVNGAQKNLLKFFWVFSFRESFEKENDISEKY